MKNYLHRHNTGHGSNPIKILSFPKLRNLRRRIIPAAAASAAALGLGGCGMLGGGGAGQEADLGPRTTASVSPESTAAQVQAFTAGLDEALARVQRDKMRAAARASSAELGPAPAPAGPDHESNAVPTISLAPSTQPTFPAAYLFPQLSATPLPLDLSGPMLTMTSFDTTTNTLSPEPEGHEHSTPHTGPVLPEPPVQDPFEIAIETLHTRIAAHPTLNTALAIALLESADGKPADQNFAPVGQTLSGTDQKLLQDLVGALESMNTGNAANAAALPERAQPLLEAAKKWQANAPAEDLSLPKLVLASRVDSYGVYNKLEPKFPVGKKQTVIIYCEVANFLPKKTDDGWYETHLAQQETLATDDGLLLYRPNVEEVEDRSQNRRHDFYLVKKLTIPDNLPIGIYALRMSVTDKNTNKIAVVTLPIEIVK